MPFFLTLAGGWCWFDVGGGGCCDEDATNESCVAKSHNDTIKVVGDFLRLLVQFSSSCRSELGIFYKIKFKKKHVEIGEWDNCHHRLKWNYLWSLFLLQVTLTILLTATIVVAQKDATVLRNDLVRSYFLLSLKNVFIKRNVVYSCRARFVQTNDIRDNQNNRSTVLWWQWQ